MGIYTVVGAAVEDANAQAKLLSTDQRMKDKLIQAVISRDRSGVFLSWATPEQRMGEADTECGWWKGGIKLSR